MFDFCFDSISIDMKDTDIPPTWQTPYATLFSTDGKPVNVYSDSSRTEIIGTYNVNKAGIRINVPLKQMTSEMIGDKIWISTSEGYIPEFEGWVENGTVSELSAPERTMPSEYMTSRTKMPRSWS